MKQDTGSEAAEELMEGLVLLREQGNRAARYWLCPTCDCKFHTHAEYMVHVEACHEELVPQLPPAKQQERQATGTAAAAAGALPAPSPVKGQGAAGAGPAAARPAPQQHQQQQGGSPPCYVMCSSCQLPVVGMFYASRTASHTHQQQQYRCVKCYDQEQAAKGTAALEQQFERVLPDTMVSSSKFWSDNSSGGSGEFTSTRDSFSSCEDEHMGAAVLEHQQQQQMTPGGSRVKKRGSQTTSPVHQQQSGVQGGPTSSSSSGGGLPGSSVQAAGSGGAVPSGMFVFGSGEQRTSAAAAGGGSGPVLGGAVTAGGGGGELRGGADVLCNELIAELEAVHAARRTYQQHHKQHSRGGRSESPTAAAGAGESEEAGMGAAARSASGSSSSSGSSAVGGSKGSTGAVAGSEAADATAGGAGGSKGQGWQQEQQQQQKGAGGSGRGSGLTGKAAGCKRPAAGEAGAGEMLGRGMHAEEGDTAAAPDQSIAGFSPSAAAVYALLVSGVHDEGLCGEEGGHGGGMARALAPEGAHMEHDDRVHQHQQEQEHHQHGEHQQSLPSAAGRTWRDWLLPKKLLQWASEGESGDLGGDEDEEELSDDEEDEEEEEEEGPLGGSQGLRGSQQQQREQLAAAGGQAAKSSSGVAGLGRATELPGARAAAAAKRAAAAAAAASASGSGTGGQQQQQSQGVGQGDVRPVARVVQQQQQQQQQQMKEPVSDDVAVVSPGHPMTDLDQEIADILNAADMQAMQAISAAWEQGTAAALAAAGLEGKLPAVLHAGLKVAAPAVTAAAAAAVEGLSGLSPSACSALLNIGCLALSNKLAVMPPSDHQQIVDDVMRRMMQMFAADREAADMTLGCLIDFVYRRLVGNMSPAVVQQVGGAGAAAVAAAQGRASAVAGPGGSLVIEYTAAATGGGDGGGTSSSGSNDAASATAEVIVGSEQGHVGGQSSSEGAAAGRPGGGASSSTQPGSAAAAGVAGSQGQPGTRMLASTSILQIPQGANVKLVEQFLAVPQVVFQQPEVLRQALYCLAPADLQMVLAYVVQQHTNALAQVEESGSEPDTSSEATCREDEPGCCPLFHLFLLNEATFEQLVERVWPGEMGQHGVGAAGGGALVRGAGGSGAASREGMGGSSGVQGRVAAARGKLCGRSSSSSGSAAPAAVAATAGAATAGSRRRRFGGASGDKGASSGVKGLGGLNLAVKGGKGGSKRGAQGTGKDEQPFLMPADWWMSHFKDIARYEENKEEGDARVLRWVYGNVVSSQAEEFLGRQQQLRGNLDRKEAILQQYEALANCWRRVRALMDKRAKLELLHSNIKEHFALAKQLEEGGEHCTPEQACSFLEALFTSLCATNAAQQQQLLGAGGAAAGQAAAAAGLPGIPMLVQTTSAAAGAGATTIVTGIPAAMVGASLPGGGNLTPPPSLQLPGATVGSYLGGAEGVLSVGAAAEEALQAELGTHQAAVQQLQVRLNQLAPLYLCEPAVEVVRSAPALARDASQQYAHALLARELAVLELVEAMLEDEGSGAKARQMEAQERIAARRAEMSAAEAEHARVLAEGPASHRKKDMLDKATKEAEHREKLADLVAKIEAAREAIAADEVAAEAAASAASELAADLARAREQAQQIAARKKNLEDLNAQLSAPVPQLALAAAAAAAAGGVGGVAGYPLGFQRSLPQLVMAVEGLPLPDISAGVKGEGGRVHGQMSCTMHPALTGLPLPSVSISATLVSTGDGSGASIAAASSSCALPLGPVALPAAAAGGGAALPAAAAPADASDASGSGSGSLPLPGTADPAAISTAAELSWSWRAQRLECLMYRVLWVAEAVKLFQQQYIPQAGGRQYELLVRASKWARRKCEEYEASERAGMEEMGQIRSKLSELAW